MLNCAGPAAAFQDRQWFSELLGQLRKEKWVVYAKPPFGGPAHVLRYLGRYTHRIAISNHRLIAFDGDKVTFQWRDYAHGNKQRVMTLDAVKFLRRFFLHVLPKGFVRIRRYGLLSNRFRAECPPLARRTLALEGMTGRRRLGDRPEPEKRQRVGAMSGFACFAPGERRLHAWSFAASNRRTCPMCRSEIGM